MAEVVRNLSLRQADHGLSAGESTMLSRARRVLVSELSFALDVSDEEAGRRLDAAMGSPEQTCGHPLLLAAPEPE